MFKIKDEAAMTLNHYIRAALKLPPDEFCRRPDLATEKQKPPAGKKGAGSVPINFKNLETA